MKRFFIILFFLICTIANSQSLDSIFINQFIKSSANPFKSDTVTISFIGDVMMHRQQLNKDYKPFLEDLIPIFTNTNINIANMEFTLAGKPYTGYPSFSAPDIYPKYVNDIGINIFLTANNHIYDKGLKGLIRTIQKYDELEKELGIKYTGISKSNEDDTLRNPLIIRNKSIKIALINATYGTNVKKDNTLPIINYLDTTRLKCLINRAKRQNADFIIACPHWGIEYNLTHSKYQEQLANWMVKNGVNIIVGAHPHVIQDYQEIEYKGNKVKVFYSIGNAVSNMSAPNTQLELMITIKLVKDFNKKVRLISVKPYYLWCTLPNTICSSYKVVIVKDALKQENLWNNKNDFTKMINTYKRVKKITKIQDI